MQNNLYHGTSSKKFDTPKTPFHLTTDRNRAERFSLRGNGNGDRRILAYNLIDNPRLFLYKNETVLEQECGQKIANVEDSLRYTIISELLSESGKWDGYYIPDLGWYCLFNSKFLSLENTEYLDEYFDECLDECLDEYH